MFVYISNNNEGKFNLGIALGLNLCEIAESHLMIYESTCQAFCWRKFHSWLLKCTYIKVISAASIVHFIPWSDRIYLLSKNKPEMLTAKQICHC